MAVLRTLIGEALRATRLQQDRTLREVSAAARVSLGYLSEVERGQKEASSELLASICRALGVRLSDVLRQVSEALSLLEADLPVLAPAGAGRPASGPVAVPSVLPAPARSEAAVADELEPVRARAVRDVVAAA